MTVLELSRFWIRSWGSVNGSVTVEACLVVRGWPLKSLLEQYVLGGVTVGILEDSLYS